MALTGFTVHSEWFSIMLRTTLVSFAALTVATNLYNTVDATPSSATASGGAAR